MILKILSLIVSITYKRKLEYKKYLEFIGINPIELSRLSEEEGANLIRAKHEEAKKMLNMREEVTRLRDLISNESGWVEAYRQELLNIAKETQNLIRWEYKFPPPEAA